MIRRDCKVAGISLLLLALDSMAALDPEAEYIGSDQCGGCHAEQFADWQGSHHDWAMKPATADYVLGDFNEVEFDHYGDKTRFSQSDEGFFITATNAQGSTETFEVAYTFGFYPLQQYLLDVGDGRYQAFTVAWDSRPLSEGGQRWFHLYPEKAIPADDVLHWTGSYFNWNSHCADCHSTNLQKNYQPASDSYDTLWSELNVGCEACHGPGSVHLQWALEPDSGQDKGLIETLSPVAQWLASSDSMTLKSTLTEAPTADGQLAVCGLCHSRRAVFGDYQMEASLEQNIHLQLLEVPIYHADGQIREEDYVLGSFMQSKMFSQGVVCSDCHNPHSLELKLPGNLVCAQCHTASAFDVPEHHHHETGSAGAECVNCHMPETTYMQVDPRRDHSLRIPRPDLTVSWGTPNACNNCHQDESANWAADQVAEWLLATGKETASHFSEQLVPALLGEADARIQLLALAGADDVPAIVQASALAALDQYPDQQTLEQAQRSLTSNEPLVRAAAVEFFSLLPLEDRVPLLLPLLADGSRLVRQAVTAQLVGLDNNTLSEEQKGLWQSALTDYETTLEYQSDSAEGLLNLALYRQQAGDVAAAETAYRKALGLNPLLLGGYLNLADLYRELGQDEQGEKVLQDGIIKLPEAASIYYSLGLLKVRQKDYLSAEQALASAAGLAPGNSQFGFYHGLILQQLGMDDLAVSAWERVVSADPQDQQTLIQLFNNYRQRQDWPNTLRIAELLLPLMPDDATLPGIINQLKALEQ